MLLLWSLAQFCQHVFARRLSYLLISHTAIESSMACRDRPTLPWQRSPSKSGTKPAWNSSGCPQRICRKNKKLDCNMSLVGRPFCRSWTKFYLATLKLFKGHPDIIINDVKILPVAWVLIRTRSSTSFSLTLYVLCVCLSVSVCVYASVCEMCSFDAIAALCWRLLRSFPAG